MYSNANWDNNPGNGTSVSSYMTVMGRTPVSYISLDPRV